MQFKQECLCNSGDINRKKNKLTKHQKIQPKFPHITERFKLTMILHNFL